MECPKCSADYYEEFEGGSSHCFGCGYHEGTEDLVSGKTNNGKRSLELFLYPLTPKDKMIIAGKWGVSEHKLNEHKICRAVDHPYGNDWLYIPIGKDHWQLRAWSPKCSSRYLMKSNPPLGLVYPVIGKGSKSDTVVVVEGVFDALRTSEVQNSVALFGSDINDSRIESLKSLAKNFIIMLDGDAFPQALTLQKKLGILNSRVVVLDKGKDPADFTYYELKEMIWPLVLDLSDYSPE